MSPASYLQLSLGFLGSFSKPFISLLRASKMMVEYWMIRDSFTTLVRYRELLNRDPWLSAKPGAIRFKVKRSESIWYHREGFDSRRMLGWALAMRTSVHWSGRLAGALQSPDTDSQVKRPRCSVPHVSPKCASQKGCIACLFPRKSWERGQNPAYRFTFFWGPRF